MSAINGRSVRRTNQQSFRFFGRGQIIPKAGNFRREKVQGCADRNAPFFLSSKICDCDFHLVSMYEVGPVKCRGSLPQRAGCFDLRIERRIDQTVGESSVLEWTDEPECVRASPSLSKTSNLPLSSGQISRLRVEM